MQKIVGEIRDQLKERDLRLTPQREAVLKVLLTTNGHLSAEEIYLATKEKAAEVGLATIYRTLELFEKLGIVRKLEAGVGQGRYEFVDSDDHYHHHLICLSCGKISEFNEDLLEVLEETISARSGFTISDHCLRFFGYCADCQKKRSR
ncbi:MAG: Fur family transcriptional regulator [Limnochordia bacterium]|jgi:Fur family ferric uptake transcriptional regulator